MQRGKAFSKGMAALRLRVAEAKSVATRLAVVWCVFTSIILLFEAVLYRPPQSYYCLTG